MEPKHDAHGPDDVDVLILERLDLFGDAFARALAVFVQHLTPEALALVQRGVSAEDLTGAVDLDDAFAPSLAQRIRVAIATKNMTAADLAHEVGVSASTISRVLRDPNRTRLTTLRKIACVLEIPLPE
ncbi:MAG: helix-turn-helix transcriptional regulator [Planctomycetota bacterium]